MLFIERDRANQEAIDIVIEEISSFVDRYDYLLSDPDNLDTGKINQAVMKFKADHVNNKLGVFVYFALYGAYGKIIMEFFDEHRGNIDEIRKKLQTMNLKMPAKGEKQHQIILISGNPHLRIALPVINKNQKTIGSINSLFVFSDKTVKAFRMRGLRAMLNAIIIVLLTTAILYPVVLRLSKRIIQFSEQLLMANLDTLEVLGNTIALRDSDTSTHNYRVSIYAVRIGEEIGLPNQAMRTLIKGAFLHDIGKIGIPDNVLRKPGKLDDTEFNIMKTHVELGHKIIKRSTWLTDSLEVILAHHEKLSGEGYPFGLADKNIPITARIFAIADVFDALTSKRPYKEAWTFEEAIQILNKGRGKHFDPFLLDTFNRIAKPLYDKFGGKEEIYQKELSEIIKRYFHEEITNLLY